MKEITKEERKNMTNKKFWKQLIQLQCDYRYDLVRDKNHFIFKNPNTKDVRVIGKTPKNKEVTLKREKSQLEKLVCLSVNNQTPQNLHI